MALHYATVEIKSSWTQLQVSLISRPLLFIAVCFVSSVIVMTQTKEQKLGEAWEQGYYHQMYQ